MNKFLYFISLFLSAFFLFTLRTNEFLGSTILSYVLATLSIFIILSFFYFYVPFYKGLIIYQLKELQKKSAKHWYGWFSENVGEFTTIFLFSTPFVLTLVSLIKGVAFLFPVLSVLNFVAIVGMALFCMPMIFVLIACTVSFFHSKKQVSL